MKNAEIPTMTIDTPNAALATRDSNPAQPCNTRLPLKECHTPNALYLLGVVVHRSNAELLKALVAWLAALQSSSC